MAVLKRKTTESKPFKPQIIAVIHADPDAYIADQGAAESASKYHPWRGDLVIPEVVIELPGIGRVRLDPADVVDLLDVIDQVQTKRFVGRIAQHDAKSMRIARQYNSTSTEE